MALSGGVDSAVAAARLVAAGEDVLAVHLRTGVTHDGESAGGARSCCGADDARDARAVAATLGIPFYVVDVAESFGRIIDDFVASYARGHTPIPCVACNSDVKFGRLREIAAGLGAETIATGHYARTAQGSGGRWRLLLAADERKDQTYMLHQLSQAQLASARFPLGDVVKDDVRLEARALGFGVADKPDSQELCFIPATGHKAFLRERAPEHVVAGAFVAEDGTSVGTHDGALGYTIGQRKGLPAVGEPRYVRHVDPATGRVEIAARRGLLESTAVADHMNWIDVPQPAAGTRLDALVRHRHAAPLHAAQLQVLAGGRVRVEYPEPVFALTPGQSLVAYAGGAVLCGGTLAAVGADADIGASPTGDAIAGGDLT